MVEASARPGGGEAISHSHDEGMNVRIMQAQISPEEAMEHKEQLELHTEQEGVPARVQPIQEKPPSPDAAKPGLVAQPLPPPHISRWWRGGKHGRDYCHGTG